MLPGVGAGAAPVLHPGHDHEPWPYPRKDEASADQSMSHQFCDTPHKMEFFGQHVWETVLTTWADIQPEPFLKGTVVPVLYG